MRVSFTLLSAALASVIVLAGCSGARGDSEHVGTQGEASGAAAPAETELLETDSAAVTGSRTQIVYAVEPADGLCPQSGSCDGFWIKKLNSYSSWRYVAAMEISSLFVTDGELRDFVSAARGGRGILAGAVVRAGIVIGSHNAIVIGSRNGIVIGSRDIVIGSRDDVVIAAKAYIANVPVTGWSTTSFWNVASGSSCWKSPCSSFDTTLVNMSYPQSCHVGALTSSSADTQLAVNETVVWQDVLVAGDRSGNALAVDSFFVQLQGSCSSVFTQAYAQ